MMPPCVKRLKKESLFLMLAVVSFVSLCLPYLSRSDCWQPYHPYLGPAAWTAEMAKDYPNSTFHGVDIAPRCLTTPPSNCHFHTKNLVEEKPFPDNHLDYIHQRLLVLGLLEANWDKVSIAIVHNMYRVFLNKAWNIGDCTTHANAQAWWMDRTCWGMRVTNGDHIIYGFGNSRISIIGDLQGFGKRWSQGY